MKQKVFIILLSLLTASLLIHCWGGEELISYKIVDFEFNETSYDSLFIAQEDLKPLNYRVDSTEYFGMEMNFEKEEAGREKISRIINELSLINTSYAFAKTMVSWQLINPIDSIKFITLRDFDLEHGANSCINDYFIFGNIPDYNNQPVLDSLSSALSYYEEPHYMSHWIGFILIEKPENDSIMELRIDMYFRDSTILTKNTHQIIFE